MIHRRLEGLIPHEPTEKQLDFLTRPDKELFYGGAAGGGKTDAILKGALLYVDVPGYAAIIFRRTLPEHELPDGLIPRSMEWLLGRARWNGSKYRWTFQTDNPKRPATLTFGFMKSPLDHHRYQSSAFQYIAFDEVTHFEEEQYRYLFSRLRRPSDLEKNEEGDVVDLLANVILRMRSASNPGGPGHEWVKRRFVDPLTSIATFIPARLEDNPYLDYDSYVANLNELDPITRRQLLEGDWEAYFGGMFDRAWFKLVREYPKEMMAARYWDLAATPEIEGSSSKPAWTAGCLGALDPKTGFYILDMRRSRLRPMDVENLVIQTAVLDQQRVDEDHLRHVDTYIEQEPGSAGKNTIEHYMALLRGYPFAGDKVTGAKELRASPVSSQAEAGNVYLVVGPWINDFLDEVSAFPIGKYKDQVDAMSGAFNKLVRRRRKPKAR